MQTFRPLQIVTLLITIGLGLGIRRLGHGLPPLLYKAIPDALWAMMVGQLFALLIPKKPTTTLALFAFVFSSGIEFSQLYHADWIDGLRNTTLGALVLGSGFAWLDILYYAIGVGGFWLLNTLLMSRYKLSQEGV